MENALYIEVNVLCVLVLVILMVTMRKGIVRIAEQKPFLNVCMHASLLFFIDVLWICCSGMSLSGSQWLNSVIGAAYFSELGVLAYHWFRLAFFWDGDTSICVGRRHVLSLLPMLASVLLSVTSIWTQWAFIVDEQGFYHRGPLFDVFVALVLTYMLVIFVRAFTLFLRKKNYARKDRFLATAFIGFTPLMAEMAQMLFPGTSILCVGITFGLLVVLFENQNEQISLDPLTRLNNRVQLNYFLESKINAQDYSRQLVVFVMDIDDFKLINEQFGYMEGDRSLLMVANVIKIVFGPRGYFLSRYDDDSFAVVAELKNVVEAFELKILFNKILERKTRKLPYRLSVSMGVSERLPGDESIPDIFERAGQDLNKSKCEGFAI